MSAAPNPAFELKLLSRVEDAGLNASCPSQQLWVDGWLVRLSPSKAKRARCVNAVSTGRLSLTERVAACAQLYADARLPMIVRITPFSLPVDLDAHLAELGLEKFDATKVMIHTALDQFTNQATSSGVINTIGLSAFAQRVGAFRGSPLSHVQEHAERLLRSPVAFHAFELQVDGLAVACAQFALEGEMAGIYDVFTAEHARSKGHATALCARIAHEAHARGARLAYLQVEAANIAARAIYNRLGFTDAYSYHYRALDPSKA